MARKLKSDKILFLATLLLVGISVVMVSSASAPMAKPHEIPGLKQAMWVALGLAVMFIAMKVDYRYLAQPAVVWMLLGVAVAGLVAVLIIGGLVNGSRRWLGLGTFGVQPSEFAKLAMVVFTAALLERRMDRINEVRYSLLPVAVALFVIAALVYTEPDLGSAAAIVATVGVIVFAAGLSWRYVVGAALASLPLVALALVAWEYRFKRFLAFLDPESDPLGKGWQLIQSKISVGAGGMLGRGLGASTQKYYFLPEPHNDFIYAVIGEETGLIGCTLVLLCFAAIIWRGLRIAARAPDRFGALLAVGLTAMIGLQALVNISVVLGLMPTKGIPLPLVSAGGSSLLVSMLAIGILLNMSQHEVPEA